MSVDTHKNFAVSTVATAPSPATSGTSLVVASGDGAKFPTVPFNATIWPASSQPTSANAEIVRITAISTDTLTITRAQEGSTARTVVIGDQIAATVTAKTLTDAEGVGISPFCGAGSDGNVTISTTVTLSQDMFYDTLTISSGGILKTNNYRVYCRTACIVNSGGALSANGGDGSGSTQGNGGSTSSTLKAGTSGGGGSTGAGSNGTGQSSSYGGSGGAAGHGSTGGAGTGGTVSAPAGTNDGIRAMPAVTIGATFGQTNGLVWIAPGGGGGGGGGDGSWPGGGGGGGGGFLILNARSVTNNGTISADGGAGAAGNVNGNTGGGGGGGGGFAIVNCASYTGTAPTANGGAGGALHGTGSTAGSSGSAGTVLKNVWT